MELSEIYALLDHLFNIDHIKINNWGGLGCVVYVVFNLEQIKIKQQQRIKNA